jgi:acyl homoserine lactone synthase
MIIVVEQQNLDKYSHLVHEMFRLRARTFRDKLKWDVQVVDGMECDKYDNEAPVYLIYTDSEASTVIGSLRLLPTTGPTLLADTFSDTLPEAVHLSSPAIWECTRFCLDDGLLYQDRRERMLFASGTLLAGLGEVALGAGINTILGNFDPIMLRVYKRIGCEVEVLGSTRLHGRSIYLGSFPVTEAILRRVKSRLRMLGPVLCNGLEIRTMAA